MKWAQKQKEGEALHLSEKQRLQKIFSQQTSAILTLDGLRPDVGYEMQQHYQSLLDEMRQEVCASEPLRKMIATFLSRLGC